MTRLPAALALLLAALPVAAQTTSADSPATDAGAQPPAVTTDEDFLRLATSANLLEIRSSERARDSATRPEVKAFAEQMIADHTAAVEEMAKAAGTTPPAPDAQIMLEPQHDALMSQLDGAQGDLDGAQGDIDAAYLDLQLKAHEDAVALFTDYATNGEEGPVKDFAEATLPKLQDHLEQVGQLLSQ